MNSKSIYHNEVVGMLAIASVLRHGTLSPAKVVLVLPFLFHKETLDYLQSSRVSELRRFTSLKGGLVANFSERYYSLLSVSLNSFFIGKEMSLFTEKNNRVKLNELNIPFDELGVRLDKINKASGKLYELLSATSQELYFNLQIKL